MGKLWHSTVLRICDKVVKCSEQYRRDKLYSRHDISPTARIGNIECIGNISIGADTYINDGTVLASGANSRVIVGRHCAIGRFVHISAKTHSLVMPTSDDEHPQHAELESSITIGDGVWIGDKAFIREGVTIGNSAIIAANSVVIDDVQDFEIVGGVPARHIRFNLKHYKQPGRLELEASRQADGQGVAIGQLEKSASWP